MGVPSFVAFDCETTGAAHFHGDLPFMCCMTFDDGKQITWEWPVDPYTRIPQYDPADLVEIVSILSDPALTPIGHNVKFDVRCIEKAVDALSDQTNGFWDGIPAFSPESTLDRCHDTHLMSHAIDNTGSHGLKDLAIRYLDLGETDVVLLKNQVIEARKVGEMSGWKIACADAMPHMKKAPTDGWWIIDMWVPAAHWIVTQGIYGPKNAEPFNNLCKIYCLRDTERTLKLFFLFAAQLEKEGLWNAYIRNQVCLAPTYHMEAWGISVDINTLLSEQQRFLQLSAMYDREAKTICGMPHLNLNAPEQKAQALAYKFSIVPDRITAIGKATIDKNELEILYQREEEKDEPNQELLRFLFCLMARSKCQTAASSHLENYRMKAINYDGIYYLHSSINLVGTDTTRTSSSDPNSQNIGKGKSAFNEDIKDLDLNIRKVFGPSPGREWWSIDYKQLQVVIAAVLSGEQVLLDAISKGDDLHETTHKLLAKELGWVYNKEDDGQRTIAKNTNFGYLFGAGEKKIEATTHVRGLYPILCTIFKQAHKQIKADIKSARELGCVYAADYRLYIPTSTPYAATVYRVQSYEALIVKRALRYCYEYLNSLDLDIHTIMIVHDELLFDAPLGTDIGILKTIQQLMEDAALAEGIPAKTSAKRITTNWAEGEKV